MKKQRKQYAPEEKVAILRRHLLEKEPISKLCDEVGLQPTVFYRWQKEFFENGAAAFEQKARPNHSAEQERIVYLQKKIQTKDEVLAGASALAYRRVVHQHQRDVLLPVQHSGRLQSLHRELGSAGVDDRGGHRDHLGARQGASPGGAAPDHLR